MSDEPHFGWHRVHDAHATREPIVVHVRKGYRLEGPVIGIVPTGFIVEDGAPRYVPWTHVDAVLDVRS